MHVKEFQSYSRFVGHLQENETVLWIAIAEMSVEFSMF